jgi:hypothetical protein
MNRQAKNAFDVLRSVRRRHNAGTGFTREFCSSVGTTVIDYNDLARDPRFRDFAHNIPNRLFLIQRRNDYGDVVHALVSRIFIAKPATRS